MGNFRQRPEDPAFRVFVLAVQFPDDNSFPGWDSIRDLGRSKCMGVRTAEHHVLVHSHKRMEEHAMTKTQIRRRIEKLQTTLFKLIGQLESIKLRLYP